MRTQNEFAFVLIIMYSNFKNCRYAFKPIS